MSDASSATRIADARALDLVSHSSLHTERLGERLGSLLRPGDVVALWGELGTGKTVLARGIARGLGFAGVASSPTFVLVNEYDGPVPMYHVDFYRLDPDQLASVGWEEYLGLGGVVVIEWPDRAPASLPAERVDIELEHIGEKEAGRPGEALPPARPSVEKEAARPSVDTKRRLRLLPRGERAREIVGGIGSAFRA